MQFFIQALTRQLTISLLNSYGADWVKYYQTDPHNFGGNEHQKKLVIGGEVNEHK